ncbi:hypothetical protein ACODYM_29075 [Burkholderia gladioli]|uniref:hypothetical protein n=1 Tax=Burkholderia gladioli TaxID=28095 RepID=UPI003B512643
MFSLYSQDDWQAFFSIPQEIDIGDQPITDQPRARGTKDPYAAKSEAVIERIRANKRKKESGQRIRKEYKPRGKPRPRVPLEVGFL